MPETNCIDRALKLHRQGQFDAAEALYKEFLRSDPGNPNVLHFLGVLYLQKKKSYLGVGFLKRAMAVSVGDLALWRNFCKSLIDSKSCDVAEADYFYGEKAGASQDELRRFLEISFENLISDGNFRLLSILVAIAQCKQPDWPGGLLGKALCKMGQGSYLDAIEVLEGLNLKYPSDLRVMEYLGCCCLEVGRVNDAIALLGAASSGSASCESAMVNFVIALTRAGRVSEAVAHGEKFLLTTPDSSDLMVAVADALREVGLDIDYALSYYAKAVSNLDSVDSDLVGRELYLLNYHPTLSAEAIFNRYEVFSSRFGYVDDVPVLPKKYILTVGFLSADFCRHSAAQFIRPLLENFPRDRFDVIVFSSTETEDDVTKSLKSLVRVWVDAVRMSDDELCQSIQDNSVDILVDLSGHTRGNRLPVFARRPAPVSVSYWVGYGYGTGLKQIDWFLGDEELVPVGYDGIFAEKVWRMSRPSIFYPEPQVNLLIESSSGAETCDGVIFGCLSRAIRINHRVIDAWASVLKRVPNSRLVVNSQTFVDLGVCARYVDEFSLRGIESDRVSFVYVPGSQKALLGMDVYLDCFPHNSGTTLFESVYMGVPFVTLADRPSVGRIGAVIARALGCEDWIAASPEEYVEIAVRLGSDKKGLKSYRRGLRAMMRESGLMDVKGAVVSIYDAFGEMYRRKMGDIGWVPSV